MIRLSTVSDSTFEPYSNICPITGYTELNIYQSNGSTTTPDETYTQSLGGTYYGGTYDFSTGKLTIDKGYVDLGSFNWTKHPTIEGGFFCIPSDDFAYDITVGYNSYALAICSHYNYVQNRLYADNTISMYYDDYPTSKFSRIFAVDKGKYATMDASQFKTAMSGVQLVYELATPTVIDLTPTQISALVGDNAMWTDGDTLSVKISGYVYAQDIAYDSNTTVYDMLSYETPTQYSDENADILIEYKEYVYGKLVWLTGKITPKTASGIGDIKTITLSHLVNAPLVNTISNNMLTESASDRTPKSRLVLKTDKTMELVGKVTANRDGDFQVMYLRA
jgi:hypothetical protein